VNVHWFIGLLLRIGFEKARSNPLYLYPCAGFLLDVLDESALLTDHLCPYIEQPDALKTNRQLRFGPFSSLRPFVLLFS